MYFIATSGGFESVSVVADDPYINAEEVGFTFTMVGEESYETGAILKLSFPSELWVTLSAYLKNVSSNMSTLTRVKVDFNQDVTITDGFPDGYTAGDTI